MTNHPRAKQLRASLPQASLARAIAAVAVALTIVSHAIPAGAQQSTGGVVSQHASVTAAPVPAAIGVGDPQAAPVPTAKDGTATLGAGIGNLRELSPWSMFLSADVLVKAVIVGLTFASLATWTILLAKSIQLSSARRQLGAALQRIVDIRSLNDAQIALGPTDNVLTSLLAAAIQEVRMSADAGGEGGIKERAASRFSDIVRVEARAARYGMGVIATIGATAPFVGLFGTVWGIMNSFIGISKAQTTNLAVVAPGIAEALLATAIGLAAAIPAVIIYNHFSRVTKGYMDLVGRGSGAVGRLLSRDLDRCHGRMISRAAE
jgi:biopolymer transport protein ExbB